MANKIPTTTLQDPPDDSGSSTFSRYRYQAKVTFPYFLRCGLDGDELAIVAEHFEDLALKYASTWRFIQIKSRDASKGMWPLSDLLGEGGALTSLFRTFRAIKVDATFELALEQPVSPTGLTSKLQSAEGRKDAKLIKSVSKAFEASESEVRDFLFAVRLLPPLPPRESIDAMNLSLIMSHDRSMTYEAATEIYERSLARIEKSMASESLGIPWPSYMAPADGGKEERDQDKYIDRAECKKALGSISAKPSPLLARVLDSGLARPTNLEMKLMSAGAPAEIIEDAQNLRANAAIREFEVLNLTPGAAKPAAFAHSHAKLTDVQQRLLARVRAISAAARHVASPGPQVWKELMDACHTDRTTLDPNSVFGQDPMLLVGETCEISDQCFSDWGVGDA